MKTYGVCAGRISYLFWIGYGMELERMGGELNGTSMRPWLRLVGGMLGKVLRELAIWDEKGRWAGPLYCCVFRSLVVISFESCVI